MACSHYILEENMSDNPAVTSTSFLPPPSSRLGPSAGVWNLFLAAHGVGQAIWHCSLAVLTSSQARVAHVIGRWSRVAELVECDMPTSDGRCWTA